MPYPPIPINQQNALPLQTVAQATAPDGVIVTGNILTRVWSPSVSGVNGTPSTVADPNSGVGAFLQSSVIDLTGMHSITVVLAVKCTNAASDGAIAWVVRGIPQVVADAGIVNPFPNLPGPDARNMAGALGAAMFPTIGNITLNAAGGPPPQPFYKIGNCVGAIGAPTSGTHFQVGPPLGVCRLWLAAPGGGVAGQQNYLTITAQTN